MSPMGQLSLTPPAVQALTCERELVVNRDTKRPGDFRLQDHRFEVQR
jgi:hypothetical protein